MKKQRGVGLIEVLISILIFSFGVLGLVGLQARAVSFSTIAEDTNRAALLASEMSAQMWNTKSLTLAPAVITAWQAKVTDISKSGLPNGAGTIVVSGNVAEITLQWRAVTSSSTAMNRYVTQVSF